MSYSLSRRPRSDEAAARPPVRSEPDEVEYDIAVVDGPAGRRLAAVQAQAILGILTWWRERNGDAQTHPDQ